MDETKKEVKDLDNPHVHHEGADINAVAVTRFGIGLFLGLVVALFGLWLLFNHFKEREAKKGPPPSAGVNVDARRLPPEPRLQSSPVLDLGEMKAAEDQILNTYAWIDPDHGTVRIPVARAMDILVQRGMPYRQQPRQPGVTDVPTESSLGFVMQREGGPLERPVAPEQKR